MLLITSKSRISWKKNEGPIVDTKYCQLNLQY